MPGPFPTDHLVGFFYREVDDDAMVAAIEKVEREGVDIQSLPVIYVERCRFRYVADKKTETHINAKDPFQYYRPPNARKAQWFTPIQMFPDEYDLFSRGLDQTKDGIPIEEAAGWLSAQRIAELKELNILTVESLASCEGSRLMLLGPQGRANQLKAAAWLKQSKDSTDRAKLAEEIRKRDYSILEMQKRIASLEAAVGDKPGKGKTAPAAAPAAAAPAAGELKPPAHLKGAARTAWLKRNAPPPAPSASAQPKADPEEEQVRATLEFNSDEDIRNMIDAYGGIAKRGATREELIAEMVRINRLAREGKRPNEAAAA